VTGATVTDTVPADLTGVAWTCVGTGGGVCPASGTGSFSHTVDLPVGATVTYTLTGTVSASPANVRNTATIAVPPSMGDPVPGNNSATDSDILICASETVVMPDGRRVEATLADGTTAWFLASLHLPASYVVELADAAGALPPGTLTVFRGDDGCTGTSTATVRDIASLDPGASAAHRLAVTVNGLEPHYRLRLVNTTGAPIAFTLAVAETTLYSAAWSTNASYNTYFSFQNTTGAALDGTLVLRDLAGAVVGTFSLSVPAGRTGSTNTAALAVPRGRTGTAQFIHDGPPGAVLATSAIANFTSTPAYVQPVRFRTQREAR
jgi:hypothetical protein